MTTRVGEGPEEVVMTSSQQTNANAITNKTSAERGTCHPVCRIETCHPTCNKPCSRTEGDKQHHHHQQQEYSSFSSPQQALFRATLSPLHNRPFPGPQSLVSTTGSYQGQNLLFRATYYISFGSFLSLCIWLYVLYTFD